MQVHSQRYLGPLQIISYALEIGLSFMEFRWPEFLIMRIFQLHASTLMLLLGKCYNFMVRLQSLNLLNY